MKFELIESELRKKYNNYLEKSIKRLNESQDFKNFIGLELDKRELYKGNIDRQKEKIIKALKNKYEKQLNKELVKLNSIAGAGDFMNNLVITLEWAKSKMWGYNPKAYTNFGFVGSSIGGCGYDKTSTAVAEALNNHLPILKLLCIKEEERLKKIKERGKAESETERDELSRREFLSYGSGYGSIPYFEGGVGVSSHESILKGLGLKMESMVNTDKTNVYTIRNMTQAEINEYKKRGC